MARILSGIVTSNKADKTITVSVNRRVAHPLYNKNYNITKKYHVHDENNEGLIGDRVEIEETRPISKTKKWKLLKIIERPESLED